MNRHKWLYVVLIGVLFLGLVPAEVTEAQGLDLNRHCRQHGRERAVNVDGTAYGWRCEDSQGQLWSMSIEDACHEQYGSNYHAEYTDFNNANSWICVTDAQPPAPPPAAQANPQSQSSPQSSAPPAQPAIVTDGCTDHPEQVYAGSISPPGGDYLRVNVANLRVRMGPSTSWCMNGYAVQGRYYPVHEVRGNWALITGTYGAGWLHTGYVTLYGSYASQNPAPAVNPISEFDLGPSCTAVGSAQLSGPTAVAGCLSSIDYVSSEDAWNMAQVLWDCGAVQTVNLSVFLGALGIGIDPASAALEAFDSQSTSDCANDLIELFGG